MVNEWLFFSCLYLLGYLIALALGMPKSFGLVTGWLWGVGVWVTGALIFLGLSIPYTLANMVLLCFAIAISALYAARDRSITLADGAGFIGMLAIFFAVVAAANQYNYSFAGSDAIQILDGGRMIGVGGAEYLSVASGFGATLPMFFSAGTFIERDYFVAYGAMMALHVAVINIYFLLYGATQILEIRGKWTIAAALVSGIFLIANPYFLYHIWFIHNNITSSAYLLVGIGCFWMGMRRNETQWLAMGMLAFWIFSITRIAALLFAIPILSLMVIHPQLRQQTRYWLIYPYIMAMFFFFQLLNQYLPQTSEFLDREKVQLYLLVLGAFGFAVFLLRFRWVHQLTARHYPVLLIIGTTIGVAITYAIDPPFMKESIDFLIINLSAPTQWGLTIFMIILLLVNAIALPTLPDESFFVASFWSLMCLLIILAIFRENPYRGGRFDSANRISLHIFGVIWLYLSLKYTYAIAMVHRAQMWQPSIQQRYGLAVVSGFWLSYMVYWVF